MISRLLLLLAVGIINFCEASASLQQGIRYSIRGPLFGQEHVEIAEQLSTIEERVRVPRQGGQENTTVIQDSHEYYSSMFLSESSAEDAWLDLEALYPSHPNVSRSTLSDETHVLRIARLPFDFPYYGHILQFIGVATSGFLFTGYYLHSRLSDFQYIAPLQANFHPGLRNESSVFIHSTEERFTVQWNNVFNADHIDDGPFTFQVSLYPSGEIHFAYKTVPLEVKFLNNSNHPVRVGISDALIFHLFSNFGVIVEYHAVNLSFYDISNSTAIVLQPLPNCIQASSCQQCAAVGAATDFDCGWCPALNRCSDGVDRHRQEWLTSNCHVEADLSCINVTEVSSKSSVSFEPSSAPSPSNSLTLGGQFTTLLSMDAVGSSASSMSVSVYPTSSVIIPLVGGNTESRTGESPGELAGITVGVLVAIALAVVAVLLAAVAVALYYAYKNPSTKWGSFVTKGHGHPLSTFKHREGSGYNKMERLILDEEEDDIL